MEILTSVKRLYISFKSLVNDFVYSFGRAALLLLVEVYNHTVPVWERRRIRVNIDSGCDTVTVCRSLASPHIPFLMPNQPTSQQTASSEDRRSLLSIHTS